MKYNILFHQTVCSVFPATVTASVTAGLKKPPDTDEKAYIIAVNPRPNATAMPKYPIHGAAKTAEPHPMKTKPKVPINSAKNFFTRTPYNANSSVNDSVFNKDMDKSVKIWFQ